MKFPGFQEVLCQARGVFGIFRESYPAMAPLVESQCQHELPTNFLICDNPMAGNSMLARQRMFDEDEYMCNYGTRTGPGKLGFFSPHQTLIIQDACTL